MFDLVITAFNFAKDFFGDDDKKMLDPKYSDFAEPSKGSSFLDFDFIKRGAEAYLDVGEKSQTPAFEVANFERPRSVSQLTRGNPVAGFSPPTSPRVGYMNTDLQNAMRILSNAQNRQVAQLIPYSAINYKGGPSPNIGVGSTTIPKRARTIT